MNERDRISKENFETLDRLKSYFGWYEDLTAEMVNAYVDRHRCPKCRSVNRFICFFQSGPCEKCGITLDIWAALADKAT